MFGMLEHKCFLHAQYPVVLRTMLHLCAAQVEEFRERQWMISNGHLSMENSLDDFRVVVGDNML